MLFVSYPLRLPAVAVVGALLLVSKAILTLGHQSNSVVDQFKVLPDVFPVAASRSEFPFIVSIRENGRHICSGTILTAQWILTAAHCFELISVVSQITIAAGKFDLFMDDPRDQIIQIRRFFNHPAFNPSTNDHDISLLQTEIDIQLDGDVQPVKLEPKGYVRAPSGVVLGWGMLPKETSIVLEKVTIPFFPSSDCAQSPWPGVNVLDSILCGQNLGQRCQGDRGGPLICSSLCGMEPVQCGLVSKDIGCDSITIPTAFTRITFHLDFIISTIAANSRSPSSSRQTEL